MFTSKSSGRLEFLTEDDWTLINAKAQRLSFGLGQEIIRPGSAPSAIYIIRSGAVSVQLIGTKDRVTVAVLGADEVCGDMGFLEHGMGTVSVIASDERVEVDAIQATDLRQVCETFSGLGVRFYCSLAVVLARRLRRTTRALAREMNKPGL